MPPPPLQPGDCPICGKHYKNLPPHLRAHERSDARAAGTDDLPQGNVEEIRPGAFGADAASEPAAKPGWRSKLWGGRAQGETPAPAAKPRERRPRARREKAGDMLGFMWSGLGGVLVSTGVDVPVGRTLQLQAPIAGAILDDLVADSFIDRLLLQRLAGKVEKWEQAGALLMLPLCIAVAERNPEMAAAMQPVALSAIRKNLAALGPAMKRMKEDEARYAAAAAELGISPDDDAAMAIWEALFAPPAFVDETPAQSNGAAAHAAAERAV